MMRAGSARPRLVLLGLLALFVAPVVLAFVFYRGVGSWFAPGAVNRAALLDPPRLLPSEPLSLAHGGMLHAGHLDRHWTLVHLAEDGCGAACAAALQTMRQAHLALGRHRTRVQRLLLVPAGSSAEVEVDHPVARASAGWRRALRQPPADEGGVETGAGIWLVDPRRFVVSYFPAGVGPRAIKQDLGRLLRLSKWQTG